MKRRITQEERAELIDAIDKGDVDVNVTAYAEAYAADRGLNPNTVRSAITRLRKEVGASELPRGRARGGPLAQVTSQAEWYATVVALVLTEAAPSAAAKIGAAALVRYDHDDEFRRAVDVERADLEKIYAAVDELRNVTQPLGKEEREAILYALSGTRVFR